MVMRSDLQGRTKILQGEQGHQGICRDETIIYVCQVGYVVEGSGSTVDARMPNFKLAVVPIT